MPQQKQPITHRPNVEEESVGTGRERHGKHRENDEALPGSGGSEGGLNRQSGQDRQGGSTKGSPQAPQREPGFREKR